MENTVNQLVLDCVAKTLRINETTKAEVILNVDGSGIECYGFRRGYSNTPKVGEHPLPDFVPLANDDGFYLQSVCLSEDGAEGKLHGLLESLSSLEKELIENGSVKAENTEANYEDHE